MVEQKNQRRGSMLRVVHVVKAEKGELVISASRVSDGLTYTPAQAVQILKRFPSLTVTVPITRTSAEELFQRWESGDVTEEPTVLHKLAEAFLNQSGDMIFVPRQLVSQLIEEYQK